MKYLPVKLDDYIKPNFKQRLAWIDMIKGISMILVMLSHIDILYKVKIIFNPFFLSSFFVVSGYSFNIKDNFSVFLLGKIKTLLVPAFLLSLLQMMMSFLLTFTEQSSWRNQIMELLIQNGGQGSKMWFVFALFIFSIFFYFLIKYIKRTTYFIFVIICGLCISLIINYRGVCNFPWYLHLIGIGCFWMAVGYLWRIIIQYGFKDTMKMEHYEKTILKIAVVIYIIFIIYHEIYLETAVISFREFDAPILFYIGESLSGTIAICLFIKKLPIMRWCLFIGQNTLVYFAFHGKIQRLVQVICSKFEIEGFLEIVIILAVQCIILTILSIIINRWLPFLVGKKIPVNKKKKCKGSY